MFSDTAGEKAAKVCSKSSLSSRLDAHHTNTKDSYLVIKKYYKIILLPKITEHSRILQYKSILLSKNFKNSYFCQRQ